MDVPYLFGRTASPLLYQQEQQGDNYDYSNNDLHNVINIGRDARNVIISRRMKHEEIEAYSPSSNYRIQHTPLHPSRNASRQPPTLKVDRK